MPLDGRPALLGIQQAVGNQAVLSLLRISAAEQASRHPAARQMDEDQEEIEQAAGAVRQMDEDQEEIEQAAGAVRQMDEDQAGPVGPEGGPLPPGVHERIEAQRGSGTALDPAARAEMEAALGDDYRDVRVHADSEAAGISRSIGAAAFTVGSDIFVDARGHGAGGDRQVLAHELTHVTQQRGASGGTPAWIGPADDANEREAGEVARAVTRVPPAERSATPMGVPTALREAMGHRPDESLYRSRLEAFRRAHPDGSLRVDRSALAEEGAGLMSGHAPPLPQIRRMGREGEPAPPDVRTIAADATVSAALESAWTASNPDAPDVPRGDSGSEKQEQGGWIIWNSDTGAYRAVRVGAGTRDGLASILGTRPSPDSPEYLVAWFHTHPNKTSENYVNQPSQADRNFTTGTAQVPGIVRAHDGLHYIDYP